MAMSSIKHVENNSTTLITTPEIHATVLGAKLAVCCRSGDTEGAASTIRLLFKQSEISYSDLQTAVIVYASNTADDSGLEYFKQLASRYPRYGGLHLVITNILIGFFPTVV